MKVSEAVQKALLNEIRWIAEARILGVSDRRLRRPTADGDSLARDDAAPRQLVRAG
jgi:hypothetical protein